MKAHPNLPLEFYRSFPKVDLHRHLEGSLRLRTLSEIGFAHGLNFGGADLLRSKVQVVETEPYTFQNFLAKFDTLRQFYRSQEVIHRLTREAIWDAAADNVHYLELRFTPVALSQSGGFALEEVVNWVVEAARQAGAEFGIKTRLIASVNRHEPVCLAAEVVRLAAERKSQGIVGIDLAGNEADFPAAPFASLFQQARQTGLQVTVHAGEWSTARNIASAILQLGAQRIGHGVRVLEDPSAVSLARENGTTFEVCLTSNYQTGVVEGITTHPLRDMISAGLKVSLNTDDPGISQITLSDEYHLASQVLGLSVNRLRDCTLAAARAAFLPPAERQQLVTALEASFPFALPEPVIIPSHGKRSLSAQPLV